MSNIPSANLIETLSRNGGAISSRLVLIAVVPSMALVSVVAFRYSYNALTLEMSLAGLLILFLLACLLWVYPTKIAPKQKPLNIAQGIELGMALGLLWLIEIGINNVFAPPLPTRDIVDDLFWAAIALLIFIFSVVSAHRTNRIQAALEVGAWSGLVSGTIACCTALSLIVFGMPFLLQDPLNVAEWAVRGAESLASNMATYFAYQTFAGAFLHLIVLGLLMGVLLGALAGVIGKTIKLLK